MKCNFLCACCICVSAIIDRHFHNFNFLWINESLIKRSALSVFFSTLAPLYTSKSGYKTAQWVGRLILLLLNTLTSAPLWFTVFIISIFLGTIEVKWRSLLPSLLATFTSAPTSIINCTICVVKKDLICLLQLYQYWPNIKSSKF